MSNFKDKMYEFEAMPPATAWDRIATALDSPASSDSEQYSKRLHDYEVAAPLVVWERISRELDADTPIIQAPIIRGKFGKVYRYAAAAAVIAAIVLIANQFTGTSGSGEVAPANLAAESKTPATKKENNDPLIAAPVINGDKQTDDITDSGPLLASNEKAATKTKRSNSLSSHISAALNFSSLINPVPSESLYTYEDHVPSIAERYVVLVTTEGNFIRMAKKWGNLSCCVSGEEQDADCKDQLKKWQIKMANSPIAPAPGNFMDILGLVNSLSDDSQL